MRFTRIVCFIALACCLASAVSAERKIAVSEIRDKIMGGWVGQGVGVCFGAPTEFRSCGKIIEDELPEWKPELLANSLGQDDMYVDMTFIASLEAYGPEITYEQAGTAFGATLYTLWHANKYARDNIRKGIMPPLSGHPKYNVHCDDIDFQIECDGLGMVCPGLPQASNDLCDIFGHIMCYGDAVYSGMWISAMYTQAFFEDDVEKVVAEGLKAVPAESRLGRCIADVIAWHRQYPQDWKKTWAEVEKKYQDDIDCKPGKPMNIDAVVNSAYVAMALLYGGGDMARTMEIGTRCGQDSDCNPSSACGILGCMRGLSGMEEQYKSYLPNLAGRNFSHTNYSYDTIADACLGIARKIIEKAGGSFVKEDGVEYAIIPDQQPLAPATLEQWTDDAQKKALAKK